MMEILSYIKAMKSKSLCLVGHIARKMKRNAGKTPLGRPRLRWENSIKNKFLRNRP
jgi:hypothetical protein